MKTSTAGNPAHCQRCNKTIACKPHDVSACDCSAIELSKEEYRFISSKFNLCVCNACLKELREEYALNFHNNPAAHFVKKTAGIFLFCGLLLAGACSAQTYAAPAGQTGTSAVYMDSSVFVSWASGCTVNRGYQDISNTSLGFASAGDATMATGKAQSNGVVSLGDGGSAVCTFEKPVTDGTGYDFAVFENGFDDLFLELAFVEVSSDGVNFFRFPAHSLTDTSTQTASFGNTDATKINNLAGKYRGGYGTPFDLQALSGTPGLDIHAVTHIKITDVVGSIDPHYASRDFYHNKINDPWPTAFPSGGFDLDAVGVIHETNITGMEETEKENAVLVYPNPASAGTLLNVRLPFIGSTVELRDASGKRILKTQEELIPTSGLCAGIYCLIITGETRVYTQKLILR